jgi:Do/DeqQ family serine protease
MQKHSGISFLLFIAAFLFFPSLQLMAQEALVPQSHEQVKLSFAPVVKNISPAVVNIYTKRTVQSRAAINPFMNDPFFSQLFEGQAFGRMRPHVESALGSGVIIQADGLAVTNAHVVRGADEIKVALVDGREFEARVVLRDDPSDLALLRLDTKGESLPFASLKPSENLEVGDIVLAIGNPFGVGQTVTSGIVSALARSSLNINDFNFFIQTDAAINPGNSGGPLVALDGGVVGINSAIFSKDGGSLGIGFAIPSEMVASVVAAEKSDRSGNGGVVRPWLGVTTQNITSEIARSISMDRPAGVLVTKLHETSPLSKAGVKVGDAILSVNGHGIKDSAEAKFRMATVPIGQNANFEIMRSGQKMTLSVAAIPAPEIPPREETIIKGDNPLNGAVIANVNPAVAGELGMPPDETGVVVMKTGAGSYAMRLVAPGDILLSINGADIANVGDASRALKSGAGRGWAITISRKGRKTQILIR